MIDNENSAYEKLTPARKALVDAVMKILKMEWGCGNRDGRAEVRPYQESAENSITASTECF